MKVVPLPSRLRAALADIFSPDCRVALTTAAQRQLTRLLDTLLPSRCALCGNLSQSAMGGGVICASCDGAYWPRAMPRCVRCALPLPAPPMQPAPSVPSGSDAATVSGVPDAANAPAASAARVCGACLDRPRAFDATIALADYGAPLDTLVIALKYHGQLALARDFARRLQALAQPLSARFDLLVPVPLAATRLAGRGYNQAWEIARPLARRLRVRASAALVERVVDTLPQARLEAAARERNVRRAFALRATPGARGRDCVRGRHIAVVDDVMTSGATLDALARTLKQAGAARITNLVVLRTAEPSLPCSTSF